MTKDIQGYEGLYTVDDTGQVISLRARRHMTLSVQRGYKIANLYKNGKMKRMYVHRAVALAFLPQIPGKNYVNHIDSDRGNNNLSNLEWCTRQENVDHAIRQGRMYQYSASHRMRTICTKGHSLSGNNLLLVKLPTGTKARRCRVCANARAKIWRNTHKDLVKIINARRYKKELS